MVGVGTENSDLTTDNKANEGGGGDDGFAEVIDVGSD